LGLFGHFFVNTGTGIWLKTTRVNDDVFVSSLATLAIMAIARKPRKVRNDGIASFGESVE
jgi:hypothetical protein